MVPFLVLPRTIPAFSSHQPFYFQRLAASWLSFFTSLPLFSIACSLFSQNTRVGGTPAPPRFGSPRRMLHAAPVSFSAHLLAHTSRHHGGVLPLSRLVPFVVLQHPAATSGPFKVSPFQPRASSLQPPASRTYIRLRGSMSTSTAVSGISFSSRYDMAPLSTLASSERFGDFSRN